MDRRVGEIRSAGIGAQGELAQLGAQVAVSAHVAECARIGAHRTAVSRFHAPDHHDVDDAADAFRIILDGGIGNHLDLLDRSGGERLDELIEVPGQHPGGPAIHKDLVILAAVQQHLLVPIDAEHRHVSENVDQIAAFGERIRRHIVGQFVGIGRDALAPGRDGRFFQLLGFAERIRLCRLRVLRPGGKAGKQGGCGKNNCLRVHCIFALCRRQNYPEIVLQALV